MSFLNRIHKALGRIEAAFGVIKVPNLKTFPPMVICPICSRRTMWIEQGHVWGCPQGHRFTVNYKADSPPPRMPGDAGDNSTGDL